MYLTHMIILIIIILDNTWFSIKYLKIIQKMFWYWSKTRCMKYNQVIQVSTKYFWLKLKLTLQNECHIKLNKIKRYFVGKIPYSWKHIEKLKIYLCSISKNIWNYYTYIFFILTRIDYYYLFCKMQKYIYKKKKNCLLIIMFYLLWKFHITWFKTIFY